MLEFEKCCFCIPLKLGCLIYGYFILISNFIMVLVFFLDPSSALFEHRIVYEIIYFLIFLSATIFGALLVIGIHTDRSELVWYFVIYSVIVITVLFVFGLIKIVIEEISAWAIVYVLMRGPTAQLGATAAKANSTHISHVSYFTCIAISYNVFFAVLSVYLTLVVRSYYVLEMGGGDGGGDDD